MPATSETIGPIVRWRFIDTFDWIVGTDAVSAVSAPVIWISRHRMLDARRNVICTSTHIGRSLVHEPTRSKYCQKIRFWSRNNSEKPGFSKEASAGRVSAAQ